MPDNDNVRANINAPIIAIPIETSYETICALERNAPINAYFELEDQPGKNQSQHADARNRQHEQHSDVHVCDHGRIRSERHDGHHHEGGYDGDVGRNEKDPTVGVLRERSLPLSAASSRQRSVAASPMGRRASDPGALA